MEIKFKFKIGDLVTSSHNLLIKHDEESLRELRAFKRQPIVFTVIEQLSVMCYGGTQLYYTCRVLGALPSGLDSHFHKYSEPELISYIEYLDRLTAKEAEAMSNTEEGDAEK